MIVHLDTQVAVWLCSGEVDRLSAAAAAVIEDSDPVVAPMVLLELEYLHEIQRIVMPPLAVLNELEAQIGVKVRDRSFAAVLHTALFETWTRDPFDRVIVAHARTDGHAPLVTSDAKIRENYPKAIW